jgi:hypothetical protein
LRAGEWESVREGVRRYCYREKKGEDERERR